MAATAHVGSLRGVLRDALIYGSGDVLLRAVGFLTLPLFTRILGPEEFGVYASLIGIQALLVAFVGLGSGEAYARFFFESDDPDRRAVLTTTVLAFLVGWSLVVLAIGLPLSGVLADWAFGSDGHATAVALGLLSGPVLLLNTMMGQALRNEFRAKTYSIINVCTVATEIALSVIAVTVLDLGPEGILGGMVVGGTLFIAVRAFFVRHLLVRRISPGLLRGILRFGIPLVPGSLAWWVFDLSDRIVLSKVAGLGEVGRYSVALSVASVLSLAVVALGLAWSPHAVTVYEQRRGEAAAFYGRTLTYVVLAFGLLAVTVTAFAEQLVALLAPPDFAEAADAVGPLALAFVASATVQVTAISISLLKKTLWLALLAWLAAVVNVALNVALVPVWGMLASAWATFASYILLTVGAAIVSQRLWPLVYQRRRLAAATVATVVFTATAPLLPDPGTVPEIALGCAVVAAYVAVLVAAGVIGREERGAVRGALGALRRRGPLPTAAGGGA